MKKRCEKMLKICRKISFSDFFAMFEKSWSRGDSRLTRRAFFFFFVASRLATGVFFCSRVDSRHGKKIMKNHDFSWFFIIQHEKSWSRGDSRHGKNIFFFRRESPRDRGSFSVHLNHLDQLRPLASRLVCGVTHSKALLCGLIGPNCWRVWAVMKVGRQKPCDA